MVQIPPSLTRRFEFKFFEDKKSFLKWCLQNLIELQYELKKKKEPIVEYYM